MSQEKSKTMPICNFLFIYLFIYLFFFGGGDKRGVLWDCASREYKIKERREKNGSETNFDSIIENTYSC